MLLLFRLFYEIPSAAVTLRLKLFWRKNVTALHSKHSKPLESYALSRQKYLKILGNGNYWLWIINKVRAGSLFLFHSQVNGIQTAFSGHKTKDLLDNDKLLRYGCEARSLTLYLEEKFGISENRILMTIYRCKQGIATSEDEGINRNYTRYTTD